MPRITIRMCAFVVRYSHTMISFLEGKIEYLGDKFVVLNAGGIGYRVHIIPKLVNSLSKSQDKVNPALSTEKAGQGSKVRLFIHSQLNLRDGTFDMYGFDKKEDLDLFHLLTTVSGIGPKGAQNILSVIEPSHLKAAIVNENADYLRKVSGLGVKTAQRLVLELKNKIDYIETAGNKIDLGQEGQATEALLSLGYSSGQAKDALKESKGVTLQERVREALKILGKK